MFLLEFVHERQAGGTDSTITIKPDGNFQYILWEIPESPHIRQVASRGFPAVESPGSSSAAET